MSPFEVSQVARNMSSILLWYRDTLSLSVYTLIGKKLSHILLPLRWPDSRTEAAIWPEGMYMYVSYTFLASYTTIASARDCTCIVIELPRGSLHVCVYACMHLSGECPPGSCLACILYVKCLLWFFDTR